LILVLPLVFFWQQLDLSLNQQELGFIIVLSILYGLLTLYGLKVIKKMELSSAIPLLEINLPLVFIFGLLLLAELPTVMQIGGIALIMFGSYLITLEEGHRVHLPFKRLLQTKNFHSILLVIAISVAAIILERAILITVSPISVFFWTRVFATLFFLFAILGQREKRLFKTALTYSGWLMPLIVLANIFAVMFYFYALSQPEALVSIATALSKLELLMIVLIGGLFLKEHNLKQKAFASSLIVAGSIAIII